MHLWKVSFIAVFGISNHFLNGEEIFVRYNGVMMILLSILVSIMVLSLSLIVKMRIMFFMFYFHIPEVKFLTMRLTTIEITGRAFGFAGHYVIMVCRIVEIL